LDDIFLLGRTFSNCVKNIEVSIESLTRLGFIINKRKSELVPSQDLKYLGFVFTSVCRTMSLPYSKRIKVIASCQQAICKISTTIQDAADLVSVCPAIPYAPLYVRQLELEKSSALEANGGSYSATFSWSMKF